MLLETRIFSNNAFAEDDGNGKLGLRVAGGQSCTLEVAYKIQILK